MMMQTVSLMVSATTAHAMYSHGSRSPSPLGAAPLCPGQSLAMRDLPTNQSRPEGVTSREIFDSEPRSRNQKNPPATNPFRFNDDLRDLTQDTTPSAPPYHPPSPRERNIPQTHVHVVHVRKGPITSVSSSQSRAMARAWGCGAGILGVGSAITWNCLRAADWLSNVKPTVTVHSTPSGHRYYTTDVEKINPWESLLPGFLLVAVASYVLTWALIGSTKFDNTFLLFWILFVSAPAFTLGGLRLLDDYVYTQVKEQINDFTTEQTDNLINGEEFVYDRPPLKDFMFSAQSLLFWAGIALMIFTIVLALRWRRGDSTCGIPGRQ